tara:strand:+ start:1442 stop:4846 length:3405 start_codon:yes stop_codon:yes gene_type:complete
MTQVTSSGVPQDQSARDDIASRLDETLFVEAGAGSGKTQALVERVVNLVCSPGQTCLRDLAVITFTHKAAAELRHRIRARFEELLGDCSEPALRETLTTALEQLDEAAISTLHGFARRLLSEHSLEAGLPPSFEVLDEISSEVVFLERFDRFLDSLFADPNWSATLLLADALHIDPSRDLLPLTKELRKDWDLLEPVTPPELTHVELSGLVDQARALTRRRSEYSGSDDSDGMIACLEGIDQFVGHLDAAFDEVQKVAILSDFSLPKGTRKGRKDNWGDIESLRSDYEEYRQEIESTRARLTDRVLRRIASCLINFILEGISEERNRGRLEYHDLLVSTREALTHPVHGPSVRAKIHHRYRHLLVDEFQDTDPIQIEIATLIAADPEIKIEPSWSDIATTQGHLFFVGDPKQSIYRFRRADISLYLATQEKYNAGQVRLSTNFRSTPQIVSWVNEVFSKLIQPRGASQPEYSPLVSIRDSAPSGEAVIVLGATAHPKSTTKDPDGLDANGVRHAEAHDITQTIIRAVTEGWSVKQNDGWRAAKFSDIAVLVPTRSAMFALQESFERAGVPFRVASSSNVWRSEEVRDLMMCLRAVDDPSDALATVSVLRSSIYGCGDDDLYRFRTSQTDSWDWNKTGLAEHQERARSGDPVAVGLAHLARLHELRSVVAPSELIGRIIKDRQLEEQCAARDQPRESLRRLRHVLDQARNWSDTTAGNLHSFLLWVGQQTAEGARPIETILPEDDDDSVQIMTIHAAKGLEFPIAVVAGLPLRSRQDRGVKVGHDPNTDLPEIKIRKDVETSGFSEWSQAEAVLDDDESIRALYVACTRACDHLVVSLHRQQTTKKDSDASRLTSVELLSTACGDADHTELDLSNDAAVWRVESQVRFASLRPSLPEWQRRHSVAIGRSTRQRFMSATLIAQSAASVDVDYEPGGVHDAGLMKDSDETDGSLHRRGRYGTAVGRAVHAVLQTVDFATGNGLTALAEVHAEAEGIAERSDEVAALAASALECDELRDAVNHRYWREIHVACPVGDTVIEGYVDLVYETDDGLVVVDYKTDQIDLSELQEKVDRYRLQGATYAIALRETTQRPVTRVAFAFLSTHSPALVVPVDDLDEACAEVRLVIEREAAAGNRP